MSQQPHLSYTALTPEGEAAVGRIAIWAAWLEFSLSHLVITLLNGSYGASSIVTRDSTASKLIELSKKLLKNKDAKIPPELQARTSTLLADAAAALKDRNEVLHGMSGGSMIPGSTAFTNRKRPDEVALYNAEELDNIGKRLHCTMEEIYECAFDLDDHLTSLTPKA